FQLHACTGPAATVGAAVHPTGDYHLALCRSHPVNTGGRLSGHTRRTPYAHSSGCAAEGADPQPDESERPVSVGRADHRPADDYHVEPGLHPRLAEYEPDPVAGSRPFNLWTRTAAAAVVAARAADHQLTDQRSHAAEALHLLHAASAVLTGEE